MDFDKELRQILFRHCMTPTAQSQQNLTFMYIKNSLEIWPEWSWKGYWIKKQIKKKFRFI